MKKLIYTLTTALVMTATLTASHTASAALGHADATTGATAKAATAQDVDVDATLDDLEQLVKDLEKLADDNKAGRKTDTKLADSVVKRQQELGTRLEALTGATLTDAQETRANDLLQRLYAVLAGQ